MFGFLLRFPLQDFSRDAGHYLVLGLDKSITRAPLG
jgi:hypothetical protein